MKKVVSIIKPFVVQQNVFVYEDSNKVDVISIPLNDIQDAIVDMAYKYDVKEIDLIGSKKYSKGIEEKIKENEMTKFSKNELVINIK